MKGSIRIVTLFGIPVHIHWTFFLIFVYIYFLGYFSDSAPKLTTSYTILIVLLFVCVLMHEFGHALTARRFGVSTHDIILSPIGGIARLSKLPEKPIQEFLVAIAGPAVNVAIALLLAPIYYFTISANDRSDLINSLFNSGGNYFTPELSTVGFLIVGLFWLNIILAVFNLLPAFPMDGGRVLRALLSIKTNRVKATRIASLIGKAFSILFIILGFFSQPMNLLYVFIGLFIYMTAANEYRMVKIEQLMKIKTGKDLLSGNFGKLFINNSISDAVQQMEIQQYRNFMVMDHWHNPLGILTQRQIAQAVKNKQIWQQVGQFPLKKIHSIGEQNNLHDVYKALSNSDSGTVLVMDPLGNASGIIDIEMFNRFLKANQKRS